MTPAPRKEQTKVTPAPRKEQTREMTQRREEWPASARRQEQRRERSGKPAPPHTGGADLLPPSRKRQPSPPLPSMEAVQAVAEAAGAQARELSAAVSGKVDQLTHAVNSSSAAVRESASTTAAISDKVTPLERSVEDTRRAVAVSARSVEVATEAHVANATTRLTAAVSDALEHSAGMTAVKEDVVEGVNSAGAAICSQLSDTVERSHRQQLKVFASSMEVLRDLATDAKTIHAVDGAVHDLSAQVHRLECRLEAVTSRASLDDVMQRVQQLQTLPSTQAPLLLTDLPGSAEMSTALVSVQQQSVTIHDQLSDVRGAFGELLASSHESLQLTKLLMETRQQDAELIAAQQQQMAEMTRNLAGLSTEHRGVYRSLLPSEQKCSRLRGQVKRTRAPGVAAGPVPPPPSPPFPSPVRPSTVISPSPSPAPPHVVDYEDVQARCVTPSPEPTNPQENN